MKIIVKPHQIKIIRNEDVNEKEINISKCKFEFDERITNEFTKEAYFTLNGNSYKQIIVNDECDFPSEILEYTGNVEIGVVAYKIDNNNKETRFNPTPRTFPTKKGSLKENVENSSTPTPSELEQLESILTNKQDKLVSGTNIKTINNQSILGEGNINIEGGGSTGTSDYESLQNKPSINNIDLIGNKTLNELGIQPKGNYANSGDIPTKLSELTNDCSFIDAEADPTVPTHVKNITQANIENWNNKSNFSGNYNDLTNKPTIPSEVTETTVSNWGFTKNTGTYSKPSEGIPKNDLSSDVQTSLGKADTAMQQNDLINYQLKPTTQNVAETSATITPIDNTIYQCGELTDITITNPPATGAYSIIFTSGSTATTTVIPSSILGLESFSASANTIYEINVYDNRAVVGNWEVTT